MPPAAEAAATRLHHAHPGLIAVVAFGGMLGTGGRYLLSGHLPARSGWPVATLVGNVFGAFLLGLIIEALVRRGGESRRGRLILLGVGTGLLGGFTTFSALAIEIERLLVAGELVTAALYAGTTVVAGLLACLLGVLVAAEHHRWQQGRRPGLGRRAQGGDEG